MKLEQLKDPKFNHLLSKKRFCLWKYEPAKTGSKPSKVPYTFKTNRLRKANIKLQANWLTGHNALEIAQASTKVDGIGIILTNSNIFAIDLDNCINPETDQLLQHAQTIVDQFSHTYIEISPSGRGLHILGQGNLNLYGRNRSPENQNIEAYDGSSVRYITITGNLWNDAAQLYFYREPSSVIQWFQATFFHQENIVPKQYATRKQARTNPEIILNNTLNQKLQSNDSTHSLNLIISRIKNSKDSLLFNQLHQGIKIRKSLSEDDWLFCKIVLRYIPQNRVDIKKELLKQILLKYRPRPKLQRSDYINRTIDKILLTNLRNYTTQARLSSFAKKNSINKKLNLVPASHIIKSCPMLQSIFLFSKNRLACYHEHKIQLKKNDDNNYIIIKPMNNLDIKDLRTYLALTKLLKKKLLLLNLAA